MLEQSTESSEVILFFEDEEIAKEMMFTEFEAILDGVVGLEDFAGQSMSAAYVVVDLQLAPTSICLFHIEFDEFGEAPKHWNVPFRTLVDSASIGPDLGAGAIQLAIRSQCPTGWYTDYLWDPLGSTLEAILQTVHRNRLCLPINKDAMPQKRKNENMGMPFDQNAAFNQNVGHQQNQGSGYHYQQGPYFGYHMPPNQAAHPGQMVPGQWPYPYPPPHFVPLGAAADVTTQPGVVAPPSIANATDQNEPIQDIPELTEVMSEDKHRAEIDTLMQEVEEKHKERIMKLVAKQKLQLTKVHDQAQKIVQKYKRLASDEKIQITELQNQATMLHAQIELLKEQAHHQKDRIEELTSKLKAPPETQNKEEEELGKSLHAAQDTIKHLREELTVLRRDSRRLAGNGTDDFFERLEDSGLSFIAFHPGAGHVSVSINSMTEYLENPLAFAARKCNISQEAYEYWLKHYEKPACLARLDGDKTCGESVKRINHPSEFKSGVSDRCQKHRTGFSASSSVGNFGLPKH